MVGHETPVLVGLSRDITCTSHLNVTKIEWILVGVAETVERREDGEQSLILPLNPTSTGLDGTRFICRVTTAKGKKFEKTITVHVKGKKCHSTQNTLSNTISSPPENPPVQFFPLADGLDPIGSHVWEQSQYGFHSTINSVRIGCSLHTRNNTENHLIWWQFYMNTIDFSKIEYTTVTYCDNFPLKPKGCGIPRLDHNVWSIPWHACAARVSI